MAEKLKLTPQQKYIRKLLISPGNPANIATEYHLKKNIFEASLGNLKNRFIMNSEGRIYDHFLKGHWTKVIDLDQMLGSSHLRQLKLFTRGILDTIVHEENNIPSGANKKLWDLRQKHCPIKPLWRLPSLTETMSLKCTKKGLFGKYKEKYTIPFIFLEHDYNDNFPRFIPSSNVNCLRIVNMEDYPLPEELLIISRWEAMLSYGVENLFPVLFQPDLKR